MVGARMDAAEKIEKVLDFVSDFFSMDDPASSFARVLKDLSRDSSDWVLVGGLAATFYMKDPRTTKDIDIVLLEETEYVAAFGERFEHLPGKPFTLRHLETMIEVDVLTLAHPMVNRAVLGLV
ncbi:MAG: nucleotidyl transferase AbiEii/AbiGii toxin family protein, partial [bacterium]